MAPYKENTKEQTPEEYASRSIEKQAQETTCYAGIKVKQAIRKKKATNKAKQKEQFQKLVRIAAKKVIQFGKMTVKAVKATVTATKALIAGIAEGGWISLAVLLAICLICFVLTAVCTVFSEDGYDGNIQAVAASQIGNIGGEPYWSWYGYDERVEWCACFVSWCADQCGYIQTETLPKFSACVDGAAWFKEREQWEDGENIPISGMIIFFDWDNTNGQDGKADHVGIVKNIENGLIYTIDGNSDDSVKINQYPIGYYEILGYGVPEYIMKTAAIP